MKEIVRFTEDRDWDQFHNGKDLALALSIEASELNEAFLWKNPEEVNIEKVKEELLHDKDFLLQIESSMKRMDEKTVCESREDCGVEESESGLDMDVDMMLDGLEMFEMGI